MNMNMKKFWRVFLALVILFPVGLGFTVHFGWEVAVIYIAVLGCLAIAVAATADY